MLTLTVQVASYVFLVGVLLLFSSASPKVREWFPRGFAVGSLLALGSFLVVLVGALVFR
ncbi:MAG TPA: hypothetical protein PKN52_11590 [Trueperaceae bacterium]|nr:hypothetical protein [Trueperaceae bacterium]